MSLFIDILAMLSSIKKKNNLNVGCEAFLRVAMQIKPSVSWYQTGSHRQVNIIFMTAWWYQSKQCSLTWGVRLREIIMINTGLQQGRSVISLCLANHYLPLIHFGSRFKRRYQALLWWEYSSSKSFNHVSCIRWIIRRWSWQLNNNGINDNDGNDFRSSNSRNTGNWTLKMLHLKLPHLLGTISVKSCTYILDNIPGDFPVSPNYHVIVCLYAVMSLHLKMTQLCLVHLVGLIQNSMMLQHRLCI